MLVTGNSSVSCHNKVPVSYLVNSDAVESCAVHVRGAVGMALVLQRDRLVLQLGPQRTFWALVTLSKDSRSGHEQYQNKPGKHCNENK